MKRQIVAVYILTSKSTDYFMVPSRCRGLKTHLCAVRILCVEKSSVLLIMTGSHARWVADNGEASAWSAMKMIIWFCFERSCLLAKPSIRVKNEGIRAGQVVSEGIEAEWKLSAEINIFDVLILLMDYNE